VPRERDLDFEALVKVTNANVAMERGRLNTALAAIKVAWQSEGGRPEDLAQEIILRGDAYREVWPKMTITPTALAVHWHRVMAELAQRKSPQQRALDELRKEKDADD
jgi:hypothetical protein